MKSGFLAATSGTGLSPLVLAACAAQAAHPVTTAGPAHFEFGPSPQCSSYIISLSEPDLFRRYGDPMSSEFFGARARGVKRAE